MNDGSTDLRKFNNIKHFSRTAMKIFRAEQQYSIRYRVLYRAKNWKPLNYVLSLEGDDGSFPASLADTFVNNRSVPDPHTSQGRAYPRVATVAANMSKPTYSGHQNFRGSYNPQGRGSGRPSSPVKRYFECNGIGHFARECPALNRGYNHPGLCPYNRGNYFSGAAVARKASEGNWRSSNARVNTCSVAGLPEL